MSSNPHATPGEIQKALFGRRKGARIRVKEDPADRTADGIVFDSGREMGVYLQFKSLLRAGAIKALELQVPFAIHSTSPSGCVVQVCIWKADFVITDLDDRRSIYDAKGHLTDVYKLKKKFVEAEYGFRILEV